MKHKQQQARRIKERKRSFANDGRKEKPVDSIALQVASNLVIQTNGKELANQAERQTDIKKNNQISKKGSEREVTRKSSAKCKPEN